MQNLKNFFENITKALQKVKEIRHRCLFICSLTIVGSLLNGCDVCTDTQTHKIEEGDIYFSALPINATQPSIFRIDYDGKNLKEVVKNGYIYSSPSKTKKIVFLQENAQGQRFVKFSDIDGSNITDIGANEWQSRQYPIISQDGKYVAVGVGQRDLYVIENQTTIRKITPKLCQNTIPVFSPDGTKMAYYEGYDLTSDISVKVVSILTDPPTLISENPFQTGISSWMGEATIDWSYDGNYLTYVNSSTPVSDSVYITPWNLPTASTGFEVSGFGAYQPVLSPDGKMVAFAGRDGNIWLRVLSGSSGKLTNITNSTSNQIYNIYPQWSPNGKYIIYTKYFKDDPYLFHGTLEIAEIDVDPPSIRILSNNAYKGFWNKK